MHQYSSSSPLPFQQLLRLSQSLPAAFRGFSPIVFLLAASERVLGPIALKQTSTRSSSLCPKQCTVGCCGRLSLSLSLSFSLVQWFVCLRRTMCLRLLLLLLLLQCTINFHSARLLRCRCIHSSSPQPHTRECSTHTLDSLTHRRFLSFSFCFFFLALHQHHSVFHPWLINYFKLPSSYGTL